MTKRHQEVTVQHIDSTDPLYFHEHYRGQHRAQPVYVELDLKSGELRMYVSGEIGPGMPERIYNGRAVRWEVPVLTPDAANRFLDEIEPHAGIALDGARIVWDGHNHVGQLDDDADDAVSTISEMCSEHRFADADKVSVWDASDYLSAVGTDAAQGRAFHVSATSTDDDLQTRADALTQEALTEGHYLDSDDVRAHLQSLRDRLADADQN